MVPILNDLWSKIVDDCKSEASVFPSFSSGDLHDAARTLAGYVVDIVAVSSEVVAGLRFWLSVAELSGGKLDLIGPPIQSLDGVSEVVLRGALLRETRTALLGQR